MARLDKRVNSASSLSDGSRKGPASEWERPRYKRLVINWAVGRLVGLSAIVFLAALATAHAQDATWGTSPVSSDWNTNTNWIPATVPSGTATFGSSSTTSITFSATNTSVGEMLFNAGAPAYSFNITNQLFITGTGIVNNSSNRPSITNGGGDLRFTNTSTAGNATITTNNPNNNGGLTGFTTGSTAGNATIMTNTGGFTEVFDTSTGGNARFITKAGGIFDISMLNSGMTTGSIEGGGTYRLGSKSLTVGSNNLSTIVSGTIVDGGFNGGTGGSMVKVGTGTLVLSGTNTYTGGTTISAGMLQLGNGGASGSISGNVIDNSVFAINRSDAFNFGGVISGTGSFQQLGTGTTTLSAVNSYSGGTMISAGVLNVSADNNLGAASGGLTFNAGTLQFGSAFNLADTRTITLNGGGGTFDTNGFNTSISQGITGSGGLTKTGPGTLTLSGSNSYSGGTVLNAGILVVNNAQALGLGNVTVNGGILKADPQPINVKGNYSQNAAGTLLLQVAGAGSGQYDFLNVSGNANLGGTLQLTNLGYKPKVGDQLTLVRTGGSISSRFANWINPFTTGSGINTIELIYSKNSVTLAFLNLVPQVPPVITTIDFASFAGTPNQRAAASLLDTVQLDSRASNLMSFLHQEPFAGLPSDFAKISPESLTAFYEISFSAANIQRLSLESRLEDIRNDSGSASGTGATVYLEDMADGKSSKNPPMLPPVQEKRWDFWSTSFGDFVHVDSDFNARGYKFTTGGIDLGIDYRLTDHLAFGPIRTQKFCSSVLLH